MKFYLLSLFSILSFSQLVAQPGPDTKGRVFGKVLDGKDNKGFEFVSVQLIRQKPDPKTGGLKDTVVAGMFTKGNGDFSFDNVNLTDSATLVVSAIGYKKIEKNLNFSSLATLGTQDIDLGNFTVVPEVQVLQSVTVVADKPVMEMGIDRRVFNVEKSITATGGTAIDVMRNIPSVTVDVDGNVSLRNASPQVFIDGRPTILTLDQIPADNIEKVELITNPSAKFDASSSAGIINVVLKKNKRIGLNGNASFSVGSPKIVAGNLSLNLRQGKFNFFVSGNINQSGGNADGKTFRQNRVNGVLQNYFNQYSHNDRERNFRSVRFGFDFFADNRNTFTVTQNFTTGKFTNNETQSQEYLGPSKILERTGSRESDDRRNFDRSGTQFIYTHKFTRTGQQFSADVNYNTGSSDNIGNIVNRYFNPDGTQYATPNRVLNTGSSNNDQLTAQADYVQPLGENSKLETGLRTYVQNNTSIFDAYSLDAANQQTKLPLSNYYKYKERVNAFYITFSNKINNFAYQAGLRAETSKFEGQLVDKGEEFGYSYPDKFKNIWDALFPSLFMTQTLGEGEDIQLNYSRRIRRPNFWQLNPYVDINDPVNIRQGNPALRPEFTNSFEFNYNKNYKGGNFLASIYYRNTMGDITQYSDTISAAQYQQLNNAAVDPNAILNTYINSKSQNRLGVDLTLQQKLWKNFEIIPNVNLQYRKVNANLKNIDLSNQGFSWEGKLIANYKIEAERSWLFNNLGFQVTGEYESPEVIPQGRRKEQYSVDFALRKEMLKDKRGTLTFSIDDVFNTRRWGTIYDTENFYQDSYRRWNVRSFRITFSYKFGDPNFSLFKKRGPQPQQNDDKDQPEAQMQGAG